MTDQRCVCGNSVDDGSELCDWCEAIAGEPPHVFRWSPLGTALWCVTCNSPYCDLA